MQDLESRHPILFNLNNGSPEDDEETQESSPLPLPPPSYDNYGGIFSRNTSMDQINQSTNQSGDQAAAEEQDSPV